MSKRPVGPRHGRQVAARLGDLRVVDLDARDVDLGEVAEEDLRLRADAAPDLEQTAAAPEREAVVHHRLEEARLAVKALALFVAVAVQVAGQRRHGPQSTRSRRCSNSDGSIS